jgi:hypothetical protein
LSRSLLVRFLGLSMESPWLRLRIPPFIVTLGAMGIYRGLALLITDGNAVVGLPKGTCGRLQKESLRGHTDSPGAGRGDSRHFPFCSDEHSIGPVLLRDWQQHRGCAICRHTSRPLPGRPLHYSGCAHRSGGAIESARSSSRPANRGRRLRAESNCRSGDWGREPLWWPGHDHWNYYRIISRAYWQTEQIFLAFHPSFNRS